MDAASLPYTCNTCLVAFRGSDAQRDHMRRDWHLYNMKRRIASLPPVSQEVFNEKVLAAKATSTAAAAKASFEKSCVACQKTFYSENSYQNHIKSSKHKLREARLSQDSADDASSVMSSTFSLGEPINKRRGSAADVAKMTERMNTATIDEDEEEDEEDEEDEKDEQEGNVEGVFSVSRCLFCNEVSADIHSNVEHMYKSHGMFIPEKEYLVDMEGLIKYLYRKINENSECLYCHAIRNSPAGIRTHMRDKGHCMIAFETEEEQIEIGQYYDFRSTYSDDGSEWEDEEEEDDHEVDEADAGRNKRPSARGGVRVAAGSDPEEEGWETETSASSLDSDEEAGESRRKAPPVIYQTDYELHLPSGRSVGHRSLARYYRQNLHNYPTAEERYARQLAIENGGIDEEDAAARDEKRARANHQRALVTRANGGLGLVGASEEQKRTALVSERRERTRALRQELRYTARVQKSANNQKHFRDPLLQ